MNTLVFIYVYVHPHAHTFVWHRCIHMYSGGHELYTVVVYLSTYKHTYAGM